MCLQPAQDCYYVDDEDDCAFNTRARDGAGYEAMLRVTSPTPKQVSFPPCTM